MKQGPTVSPARPSGPEGAPEGPRGGHRGPYVNRTPIRVIRVICRVLLCPLEPHQGSDTIDKSDGTQYGQVGADEPW